ncbi:hypothetical protein [Paenibacillus sp. QZ-Y1]|uniref:hypothetical protein n=1 Tax=Paenibacillus sp. QZ-Y1 TaxID=3414511 RepID=UPI003F7A30EC
MVSLGRHHDAIAELNVEQIRNMNLKDKLMPAIYAYDEGLIYGTGVSPEACAHIIRFYGLLHTN